jgi:hypothetical protein
MKLVKCGGVEPVAAVASALEYSRLVLDRLDMGNARPAAAPR